MSEIRTFAGLTIDGEITAGAKRANQRPAEELAPLLQALVDDTSITSFGWTQYTPYFNDGDPCVFNAHTPWVRTEWDADGVDEYAVEVSDSHPSLGNERWNGDARRWETFVNEHYDKARYDRCKAMAAALEGGEFDDVLIDRFGDHAEVTVTRGGITVAFYEHG